MGIRCPVLADEPCHSLTPLQPSQHRLYVWEEAPESSASRANRSRQAGSIDEGFERAAKRRCHSS
jgi:hypothetical protein